MVVADPLTDYDTGTEVERRAGDRAGWLRQRDRAGIDAEKMIGGDSEMVVENVSARACAGQIERSCDW